MQPIRVNKNILKVLFICILMGFVIVLWPNKSLEIDEEDEHYLSTKGLDDDDDVDIKETRHKIHKGDKVVFLGESGLKNAEWSRTLGGKDDVDESRPLYIITPTYPRIEQLPELVRMGQTLKLVKNVHWLIVEEADTHSWVVTEFLKHIDIRHEHLLCHMPDEYLSKRPKPRGVANRNKALEWIRKNGDPRGVFYFGDDDNTYDVRLFNEMRRTRKISAFPVGLVGNFGVSTPIVNSKNKSVTGFFDVFIANRKFPMDMAGFAISVDYYQKQCANGIKLMPFSPGYEETGFLRAINLEVKDLEPVSDDCSKILVWHTKTNKNDLKDKVEYPKHDGTNVIHIRRDYLAYVMERYIKPKKTNEKVKEKVKEKK